MREESHLDDMRAAIRGDFERLAERRGAQDLMRVHEDAEPEAEDDDAASADESPPEELESERSWVDRLLGR